MNGGRPPPPRPPEGSGDNVGTHCDSAYEASSIQSSFSRMASMWGLVMTTSSSSSSEGSDCVSMAPMRSTMGLEGTRVALGTRWCHLSIPNGALPIPTLSRVTHSQCCPQPVGSAPSYWGLHQGARGQGHGDKDMGTRTRGQGHGDKDMGTRTWGHRGAASPSSMVFPKAFPNLSAIMHDTPNAVPTHGVYTPPMGTHQGTWGQGHGDKAMGTRPWGQGHGAKAVGTATVVPPSSLGVIGVQEVFGATVALPAHHHQRHEGRQEDGGQNPDGHDDHRLHGSDPSGSGAALHLGPKGACNGVGTPRVRPCGALGIPRTVQTENPRPVPMGIPKSIPVGMWGTPRPVPMGIWRTPRPVCMGNPKAHLYGALEDPKTGPYGDPQSPTPRGSGDPKMSL